LRGLRPYRTEGAKSIEIENTNDLKTAWAESPPYWIPAEAGMTEGAGSV